MCVFFQISYAPLDMIIISSLFFELWVSHSERIIVGSSLMLLVWLKPFLICHIKMHYLSIFICNMYVYCIYIYLSFYRIIIKHNSLMLLVWLKPFLICHIQMHYLSNHLSIQICLILLCISNYLSFYRIIVTPNSFMLLVCLFV